VSEHTIYIEQGYIENGIIFSVAWKDHPVRNIGTVKDINPSDSIRYFEEKFEKHRYHIIELVNTIESSDNKGSFLMKCKHLKESLPSFKGLGDFVVLDNKLDEGLQLIEESISANRKKNSQFKRDLLGQLKEASELVNWQEATQKLNTLKTKWIKIGSEDLIENDCMNSEFWAIYQSFHEKKKSFFDDKKKLSLHYENKYEQFIKDVRSLQGTNEVQKSSKLITLKTDWQTNGAIANKRYQKLKKEFDHALKELLIPKKTTDAHEIKQLIDQYKGLVTHNESSVIELQAKLTEIKKRKITSVNTKHLINKAYDLLNFGQEYFFILSLCNTKYKQFEKKPIEEQYSLKRTIIKELIKRDHLDLGILENNQGNINSENAAFKNLIEKKIAQQRKKIVIKQRLLVSFED